MNQAQWYHQRSMSDFQETRAYRISLDTYEQHNPAHSFQASPTSSPSPDSYGNSHIYPYTPTHNSPDLPPSLSVAASAAASATASKEDLDSALWQQASRNSYPSSSDEEPEFPADVVLGSFLDRTLRQARPMEHYKFSTPPTNLSDCPGSDGRTSRTRVDSGINFPYDVPVEDEDDVSPAYSPSLQYHLIQSSASAKSKIDFAEIFTPPATSTHHLQLPSTIFSSQTFMSDLLPENVVLYCEHCRPTVKSYSGTYARRNLSRHIFQTHSSSDEFPCSVPNCPESFRRTDARLVHERRSHPELERAPAVRRKKSGEE